MASFVKFQQFVEDLGNGVHNLDGDDLYIMLTDTAPTAATDAVDGDITEISAAHGYSAGGAQAAANAYAQSSGTGKLVAGAVTFTASGGTVGPFQYAVLYNASVGAGGSHPLIGYWDYGSEQTLQDGDSFTVGKDSSGNDWDSSTPLMTVT